MSSAALGFSSLASVWGPSRAQPSLFLAGLLASPASSLNIPSLLGELWDGLLKAVPKKKTSHMKQRSRLNAGKALQDVAKYVRCASCGNPKKQHHLCPFCTALLYKMMPKKDESIYTHKYDLAWKNKQMPFFADNEAVAKRERAELKWLYKEKGDTEKLAELRALEEQERLESKTPVDPATVTENLNAWIKRKNSSLAIALQPRRLEEIKKDLLVLYELTPSEPNKAPLPASPPMPSAWADMLQGRFAKMQRRAGQKDTNLEYEMKREELRFFVERKHGLLETRRLDKLISTRKEELNELRSPASNTVLTSSMFSFGWLFSGWSATAKTFTPTTTLHSEVFSLKNFMGGNSGSSPKRKPFNHNSRKFPESKKHMPRKEVKSTPNSVPRSESDIPSQLAILDLKLESELERLDRSVARRAAEGKPVNMELATRVAKYRDLHRRQKIVPNYWEDIQRLNAEIKAIRQSRKEEEEAKGNFRTPPVYPDRYARKNRLAELERNPS